MVTQPLYPLRQAEARGFYAGVSGRTWLTDRHRNKRSRSAPPPPRPYPLVTWIRAAGRCTKGGGDSRIGREEDRRPASSPSGQ